MKQTALVLGAGGQLGRELLAAAGADIDCVALMRSELDVGDRVAVARCLAERAPQLLVNAAAYTAVDRAETEAAACWRSNAEGPANLALACRDLGIRLLHVSTDFVFDGSATTPYSTLAPTAPLGEYGRSKLAGEQAIQRLLPSALVVRTGWLYSRFGSNFVKTMLRLMSQRDEISVVADQTGTPTWAGGLAQALWAAARRPALRGVYHWSDAGECSWYDFAVAIHQEASALGLLTRPVTIRPIAASEYPTAARRPAYSVLDKTSSWRDLELPAVDWRVQLHRMLTDLKESSDE